MNMHLSEHVVPLEDIDPDDTTFRITTRTEDLTASILRLGVVHAPILQPRKDRWRIITGFRRISACREMRLARITAKRLSPDATEQQRIHLAIADNSLQRPLSLIETARSLKLLSRCHSAPDELTAVAADLNLPNNADLVQKLLQLTTLSESIQNGVRNEVIALSMALALGGQEKTVAEEWIRIFRDLNAGLNRQRELMTLVAEIAIREDRPAAAVLFDADIRQILSSDDGDASQKYRRLAAYLRKRRYPHITRVERRFQDLLQALPLGPRAQLTYPPHFEGTQYQLRLLFKDLDELERHRQTLEELLQHSAFRDHFK